MRVIFLDIDGVLNAGHGLLDPEMITRLNMITDTTKAVIVVSSMWRWSLTPTQLESELRRSGVTAEISSATPTCPAWVSTWPGWYTRDERLTSPSQGDAIRLWLADHPGVTAWVVLDDQPIEVNEARVVRTWSGLYWDDKGLSDEREHVERAIAILGGAA